MMVPGGKRPGGPGGWDVRRRTGPGWLIAGITPLRPAATCRRDAQDPRER